MAILWKYNCPSDQSVTFTIDNFTLRRMLTKSGLVLRFTLVMVATRWALL